VPDREHGGDGQPELEAERARAVVHVALYTEDGVDEDSEGRVQHADIVEHIVVLHRQADEENHEVQPPHHLAEPDHREVSSDVVVREVAEAGHPDVAGDEQTNAWEGGSRA
jgi:hypothetical protein